MNIREFSDTVKMEMVIRDINRYQEAYKKANKEPNGILVRWKSGWFAIGKEPLTMFVRPTKFRNMTDELERRIGIIKRRESK